MLNWKKNEIIEWHKSTFEISLDITARFLEKLIA